LYWMLMNKVAEVKVSKGKPGGWQVEKRI